MERREALRLLAAAAALPLIPGELYAVLRAARACDHAVQLMKRGEL